MTIGQGAPQPDIFRPWRGLLGAIALLVVEAGWVSVWLYTYFADCPSLSPAFWLSYLIGSGVVALLTTQMLRARVKDPNRRRGIGWGLLLGWMMLAMLIGARSGCTGSVAESASTYLSTAFLQVPGMAALVFGALLTWRSGVGLAAENGLDPESAAGRLRRAVLGLSLYLFVFRPGATPWLVGVVLLTFLSGLVGVALSRAQYLTQVRAAARLPFRGAWLVTILLLVGAVVAAGWVLGWAIGLPPVMRLAGAILEAAGRAAVAVVGAIARAVIAFGAMLVGLLAIQAPEGSLALTPAPTAAPATPAAPDLAAGSISTLAALGQQLELILSLLVLILLAYLAVRSMGGIGLSNRQETRFGFEALLDEGEDAVRPEHGRLRRVWNDMRRRARLRLPGGEGTESRIRQLYRRLLRLAASSGRPRLAWETPRQAAEAWTHVFPSGERELELMTSAYEAVRYGAVSEDASVVSAVEQALKGLQRSAEHADRQGKSR